MKKSINRQDAILITGLLSFGVGFYMLVPAAAFIMTGLLLFLIGVGVFAPKGD